MKQVLILNGDIEKTVSIDFLINAYKNGAEIAGATIREIAIIDLIFNSNKLFNNRQIAELEPGLQKALSAIRQSNHVVLFCPVYVDHIPAKSKDFLIDFLCRIKSSRLKIKTLIITSVAVLQELFPF